MSSSGFPQTNISTSSGRNICIHHKNTNTLGVHGVNCNGNSCTYQIVSWRFTTLLWSISIQNRCLGNTLFYCNQASFTFLSSSFFHACFYSQFSHPFVYIFACAPHFSHVKGYRLIAESLCF